MPTITIDTSAAHAARTSTAFGKLLDLRDSNDDPRDATLAEIKAKVIDMIRETVLRYEHREAEQTARDSISSIAPT